MTHPNKLLRLAIVGSAPAILIALWLLWTETHELNTQLTLSAVIIVTWIICLAMLHEATLRPLQTAANLLTALREGDFSLRGKQSGDKGDPLVDLHREINALGELLRSQRLNAVEATALVQAVMEAINVAVFAFDAKGVLRLANPAGIELLGKQPRAILGHHATELGLADCLEGAPVRVLSSPRFQGGSGRWGLHRSSFRERGLPHSLIVISDISSALRAEETQAWQRLVRVIGHELNNSLTPIKSLAGSLATLQARSPRPADFEADLCSGLGIISNRADNLARFMEGYARLARLPAPSRTRTSLHALIQRAVSMERRLVILIESGPELQLHVDAPQIENVLINLLKNAADSALGTQDPTKASVRVAWLLKKETCQIQVEDNGQGLSGTTNLFVPFFTTKADGSGIGLVLSRQIAENHGGSLSLEERRDGLPGCIASLELPLTD